MKLINGALFRPIEVKPKPIGTASHAFSWALRQPYVLAFSFDWFIGLFVSFGIGYSDDLGFGLTILNWNPFQLFNQQNLNLNSDFWDTKTLQDSLPFIIRAIQSMKALTRVKTHGLEGTHRSLPNEVMPWRTHFPLSLQKRGPPLSPWHGLVPTPPAHSCKRGLMALHWKGSTRGNGASRRTKGPTLTGTVE